jgi:hypothetical protein
MNKYSSDIIDFINADAFLCIHLCGGGVVDKAGEKSERLARGGCTMLHLANDE